MLPEEAIVLAFTGAAATETVATRGIVRANTVGGDHEVLNDVFGPVPVIGFQVLEFVFS